MFRPELRRIALRLFALCILLACLMAPTPSSSVRCATNRAALICCSACEVENPPLPCRHGCSPSCAANR
jgi:hypothetical protein